jgi:hypothetical protein
MKDLLNYLKDSELWQSALDLGYESSIGGLTNEGNSN